MRRDFDKIVEDAKKNDVINNNYDMSADQMIKLVRAAQESIDACMMSISDAFIYGYVMGSRATKAEIRKSMNQESRE